MADQHARAGDTGEGPDRAKRRIRALRVRLPLSGARFHPGRATVVGAFAGGTFGRIPRQCLLYRCLAHLAGRDPVLLVFFGLRRFGGKGTLALAAAGVVLGAIIWISSPHLQQRIGDVAKEVQAYETSREVSSAGQRLDYWKNAAGFIKDAPVIGHGTGTIRQLFDKATAGEPRDWQTANPHNQTLAVGIQLGMVGILALWALWISHFLLFRSEAGLAAWIGEMVVVQNIVSSLFNSHLFDFTQGWIYVFGVGAAGGVILRRWAAAKSGADRQRPV
jgi:O-antigen ligase